MPEQSILHLLFIDVAEKMFSNQNHTKYLTKTTKNTGNDVFFICFFQQNYLFCKLVETVEIIFFDENIIQFCSKNDE